MKTSNLIFLFSLLISFSFYESKTLRKSMNIEDPLLILSEVIQKKIIFYFYLKNIKKVG